MLRFVFLGLGLFRKSPGLLFTPISSFSGGGKPFLCSYQIKLERQECVPGNRLDIHSGLSSEDENTTNDNSYDCLAKELIMTSPASLCSLMASENNIQGSVCVWLWSTMGRQF